MQTHTAANIRVPLATEPPPPGADDWLTLQQGAKDVQVHEATLRREIKAGRLQAARVGGRRAIRIRRSWLDDWLEASAPVEVQS